MNICTKHTVQIYVHPIKSKPYNTIEHTCTSINYAQIVQVGNDARPIHV